MSTRVSDEVVFSDTDVSLRATERSSPLMMAWTEIAALDVSAMKFPGRVLRILVLVHQNGDALEVTEDCVGFLELVNEIRRRFDLASDLTAAMNSLRPGSQLHIEIHR